VTDENLNHSDGLTGLANRSKFLHLLNEKVSKAEASNVPLGLLIVDIHRFHKINTIHGHAVGDYLLQAVARILKNVCREGDALARIGDDQFAMLLDRVANKGHVQLAATKIQRLLAEPIFIEKQEISFKVIIGVSAYPSIATQADKLLQSAERALEHAKIKEKPISWYENNDTDKFDYWNVEASLEKAIPNSEYRLYFQPKVSLTTAKPIGAEALIRWDSPAHGMLSPAAFLPIAGSIDILKPLTIWMLNSALRLSSEWTEKWGRLSVSVNIPPSMLEQSDFVDMVLSADNLWQRDHVVLCLEILEQSLVADVQTTFKKLERLRKAGVRVAIDDFGTGYSSLSYFRDIPTDELKIDQSFIKGLKVDKANMHIVSLIIDMAHRFGMSVVAEGVESHDALMYLKHKGCDQVQGFYIAEPMTAEAFFEWIESYQLDKEILNTGFSIVT
jgi:diguanylate cyclase (GGDEF)-like protein